jgi:hypothetical protein
MIPLGLNNIIILEDNSTYTLSSIFKFFEISQINFIHFKSTDYNYNLPCRTVKFSNVSDLFELISNNLFRLELIVVDSSFNHKSIIDNIREITNLPLVFLSDRKPKNISIFDTAYLLCRDKEYNFGFSDIKEFKNIDANSYITDIINNTRQTIESLRLEATRDYKLNKILK